MSASKTIVPLVIVGGVAYLGYQAYNTRQAVGKLSIKGAKVLKIDIGKLVSVDIQVQLLIDNPSGTNIPLEYYNGQILNAGQKLSDFSFNGNGKNIIIKAHAATPINFTLNVSALTVIAKIADLITNAGTSGAGDSILQFNGTVTAGGVDIPANFTYDTKPGAINGIAEIGKFKFGQFAGKFLRHSALGPLAMLQDKLKKRRKKHQQQQNQAHSEPTVEMSAEHQRLVEERRARRKAWFEKFKANNPGFANMLPPVTQTATLAPAAPVTAAPYGSPTN